MIDFSQYRNKTTQKKTSSKTSSFTDFLRSKQGTRPIVQQQQTTQEAPKQVLPAMFTGPLQKNQTTSQYKVAGLPPWLGGGAYNINLADKNQAVVRDKDGNIVTQNLSQAGHTTYGNVASVPGMQRDDIVPVALGGANEYKENIKLKANNPVDLERQVIDEYKSGKISLAQARLKIITAKQEMDAQKPRWQRILDKAASISDDFLKGLTSTFTLGGITEKGTKALQTPADVLVNHKSWKEAYNQSKDIGQQTADLIIDTVPAYKELIPEEKEGQRALLETITNGVVDALFSYGLGTQVLKTPVRTLEITPDKARVALDNPNFIPNDTTRVMLEDVAAGKGNIKLSGREAPTYIQKLVGKYILGGSEGETGLRVEVTPTKPASMVALPDTVELGQFKNLPPGSLTGYKVEVQGNKVVFAKPKAETPITTTEVKPPTISIDSVKPIVPTKPAVGTPVPQEVVQQAKIVEQNLPTSNVQAPTVQQPVNTVQAIPVKPPPKTDEFTSRVFERMKSEHPEALEGDLKVAHMTLEEDAKRAVNLIAKDKQKAYDIAMGKESSSEITSTSANIALAEKALSEGNHALYGKLVKNRSLAQTRRGQEIVAEKGSVTDNSTARYIKELIAAKLDKLGNSYLGDLKDTVKGRSTKQRAMAQIDKEVSKVQNKIKNKKLDVKTALSMLDKLTCIV